MKFQQLSPSYIAKLTTFLQEEEISILEEWLRATKIKNDDPFYDEIIKNGKQTIRLIGTKPK
jgi:predicted metalloendopeptidase